MSWDTHLDQEVLLRTDIDDLPKICAANQHFRAICSSREWWQQKYHSSGLILLDNFNTFSQYLLDYKTSLNVLRMIEPVLNVLRRPKYINHEGVAPIDHQYQLMVDVINVNDYNFPEVDIDNVRLMHLKAKERWTKTNFHLQAYTTEFREGNEIQNFLMAGLTAFFYYSHTHQTWILNLLDPTEENFNRANYVVKVSENTARTFIYTQVYRGYRFTVSPEESEGLIDA